MSGKPHEIHVDNATEFRSEALRRGCAQHGITLTYRPKGMSHFGDQLRVGDLGGAPSASRMHGSSSAIFLLCSPAANLPGLVAGTHLLQGRIRTWRAAWQPPASRRPACRPPAPELQDAAEHTAAEHAVRRSGRAMFNPGVDRFAP